MKLFEKVSKSFAGKTLLGSLLMLALLALAIIFFAHKARAQQYFTNSTSNVFGAYQYNANFSTPLYPSRTLANQYANGILTGFIPAGGALTNNFSTNIFSTAPSITYSLATNAVTTTSYLIQVTTSNFSLSITPTNNAAVYWVATGH